MSDGADRDRECQRKKRAEEKTTIHGHLSNGLQRHVVLERDVPTALNSFASGVAQLKTVGSYNSKTKKSPEKTYILEYETR